MFDEVMRRRFSARFYRPSKVENTMITYLLEAARLAPSSRNDQPWQFVVLRDIPRLVDVLSAGNEWVLKAPLVVAALRHGDASPFNLGLAVENMLLAATDLGLSGHVVGGIDRSAMAGLLLLPEETVVECLLTFGYPANGTPGESSKKALSEIAFDGELGNPWPHAISLEPSRTIDIPVTVRFRDLDAMGHVNNATYFTFLEEARIGFRERAGEQVDDPMDFHVVVAENHLKYRKPIIMGERIIVRCWISHVKEKSYFFHYKVVNGETGEDKAIGHTVMVGFDYQTGRVEPLGDDLVALLRPYSV